MKKYYIAIILNLWIFNAQSLCFSLTCDDYSIKSHPELESKLYELISHGIYQSCLDEYDDIKACNLSLNDKSAQDGISNLITLFKNNYYTLNNRNTIYGDNNYKFVIYGKDNIGYGNMRQTIQVLSYNSVWYVKKEPSVNKFIFGFPIKDKTKYGRTHIKESYLLSFEYLNPVDAQNSYINLKNSLLNLADPIADKDNKEQQKKITNSNALQQFKHKQYQDCLTSFKQSKSYKDFYSKKNTFINTRYNNCINNGYDSTTCYAYKLNDSAGYDLEYSPPNSNCQ